MDWSDLRVYELVKTLERLTPFETLTMLNNGNAPSKDEVYMIAPLKLNTPVINVLIYYIYLLNDCKLHQKLVDNISFHWHCLEIQTAKEALIEADKQQRTPLKAI
jgi:replication initiation and membrane attachment protein DnaB